MIRGPKALAAAALILFARTGLAQFPPVTDPNKDEAKCQASTNKALAKFIGAKTKCVSKCMLLQRKAAAPYYAGCFAPAFTDPATNACIFDPSRGAEAKARARIVKGCSVDCPECYPFSACATGDPFVADLEGVVDPFVNLVYCTEALAQTPTQAEAKCEDTVWKQVAKFWSAKSKCYAKCTSLEQKGKIAPGSCEPPVPSDPSTAACIFDPVTGAEAKAIAAIDKICEPSANPSNQKPVCYSILDGAGWISLLEANIDFRVPITYCDESTTTSTSTSTSTTTSTSTSTSTTTTTLCAGDFVGGSCWFKGALGADCTSTCAANSLSYDPATATYAGSGGSDANCTAVAVAVDPSTTFNSDANLGGVGCCDVFGAGAVADRDLDPTTATATNGAVARYCACN